MARQNIYKEAMKQGLVIETTDTTIDIVDIRKNERYVVAKRTERGYRSELNNDLIHLLTAQAVREANSDLNKAENKEGKKGK